MRGERREVREMRGEVFSVLFVGGACYKQEPHMMWGTMLEAALERSEMSLVTLQPPPESRELAPQTQVFWGVRRRNQEGGNRQTGKDP